MRMGKCSIKESFIQIERGEVFVYGMHISPYEKGNIFNKDPLRTRKLLLHQYETVSYTHRRGCAGRIVKAGIFPECLCGILPAGPVFKRRLAGGMETF